MTSPNSQENRLHPGWLVREANRLRIEPPETALGAPPRRGPSPLEAERENTLRDFLGKERAAAVLTDLRPDMKDIGTLVNEQLARLKTPEDAMLERIRLEWASLVDDPCFARETFASHIERGRLVVEVTHPAWFYVLEREALPTVEKRIVAFSNNLLTGVILRMKGRFRRSSIR